MVRKIFLFLVAGIFVFGMSKLSFAMDCGSNAEEHSVHHQISKTSDKSTEAIPTTAQPTQKETTSQSATEKSVDVGNKICPVSGEKINEKTKATYEYEGKIYNFCCPMCIEEFKNDPQKYIKKVEEEMKEISEEKVKEDKEMAVPDSQQMQEGMHQSHHH